MKVMSVSTMTIKEYDAKVDELKDKKDWDNLRELQVSYMTKIMNDLYAKAEAYKDMAETVAYLIEYSASGSVNSYVDTKEMAELVAKLSEEELGDYMLDAPEVVGEWDYKNHKPKSDEETEKWEISYMFGGNYTPDWDGWEEDNE